MAKKQSAKSISEIAKLAPALLVIVIVFALTAFMGWREVNRIYPALELERVATEGEAIEREMETFLESGIPLKHFVGFHGLVRPVLETDPTLSQIYILDNDDQIVFSLDGTSDRTIGLTALEQLESLELTGEDALVSTKIQTEQEQEEGSYEVIHPLSNKFEQVGQLVMVISKESISKGIREHFTKVLWMISFAFLVFGLGIFFTLNRFLGVQHKGRVRLTFVFTSLVGGLLVLIGVTDVYHRGLNSQTEAVTNTLGLQFQEAHELGLEFTDFSDLETMLTEFRDRYPEVPYLGLVQHDTIAVHTDPNQMGKRWQPSEQFEEYRIFFESEDAPGDTFFFAGTTKRFLTKPVRDMLKRNSIVLLITLVVALLFLEFLEHFIFVGFRTAKIPALLVLGLSLVLLFYVGLGEIYRNFPKMHLNKMAVQGDALKQSMEVFLKAGVPLGQFVGFKTLTDPILESDSSISQIICVDREGKRLYLNQSNAAHADSVAATLAETISKYRADESTSESEDESHYQFETNAAFYQVSVPISNKFEEVGSVLLRMPSSVVAGEINRHFSKLGIWMGGLVLVFAIFLFGFRAKWVNAHPNFLNITYGVTFFIAAVLVVNTLVEIYSKGIESEVRVLSISLGKRLDSALELGLPLVAFRGIDNAFEDYRDLNPTISGISLVRDGRIAIDNDPTNIGQQWQRRTESQFEFNSRLHAGDAPAPQDLFKGELVTVSIPKGEVYSKLWRSVKNFMALFIATGFLATLFLSLMFSLNSDRQRKGPAQSEAELIAQSETRSAMIKILYFLIVFMEGLFSSFLPIYFQKIAVANGLNSGSASILFTVYFAAFAAVLIPSGKYADKKGVRALLLVGVFFTTVSVFGMAAFTNFHIMMVLRILAGFGQGMVFIGVQSFLLANAVKGKATKGTSVIVFGYNAGMISGTAIGALLVLYMGALKVFILAATMGIVSLLYIVYVVPPSNKRPSSDKPVDKPKWTWKRFFKNLTPVFKDLQFLKTIGLIGLTTKMTLTGIIVFALPLVMIKLQYLQDDIGQVLMFYAIGVLISNRFAAKVADRTGNTSIILFVGSLGSGLGLILMGLANNTAIAASGIPFAQTLVITVGVLILGLAHGFIHAPIVTHIAKTDVAGEMGRATVISTYRFMERFGHVAGPMVVSFFLVRQDYNPVTLSYLGIAIGVLGAAFLILKSKPQSRQKHREA